MLREIRRRTRVVGAFPDGQSALQPRRRKAAPHRRHGVVDEEISEHRVAEGPADERCHHRVSQGRAPLSQPKVRKILDTTETLHAARAPTEVLVTIIRFELTLDSQDFILTRMFDAIERVAMAGAYLSRRRVLQIGGSTAVAYVTGFPASAQQVNNLAPQPYFASVMRAIEALAAAGAPITRNDADWLAQLSAKNDAEAIGDAEQILSRYTLARLTLDKDGFGTVTSGGADKTLIEQGWSAFLVRVDNPTGLEAALNVSGSNASISAPSTSASRAGLWDTLNLAPSIVKNWFRNELYKQPPLGPTLSGFPVEYRIVQIYSRDRGPRDMKLSFWTSPDPQAEWLMLLRHKDARFNFDCRPSADIPLAIRDVDGRGCMASLIIKDKRDRVYPLQAMRLAPDMYFHPQVYRADGETVRLPDGEYVVESRRGPEYLVGTQHLVVTGGRGKIDVQLKRWIDPAKWGWYSGDTHIHGGGCAHYERPTEGVMPETMIRHVRGEGLSIGVVLNWGPSWYYQKQFFTGKAISPPAALEHPELQAANNASLQPKSTAEDAESSLRYDVEVSMFPSSHCGHLVLLRLKEQDYPGTEIIQDWPSWNLPIMKWAKEQGAVIGYAHCGSGMEVSTSALPNYEIPPMDGIGTQEAIMDVTHGLTDFISGVDTLPAAELNAWYHMLNCGFRLALIGETDYPCISGERPGVGRSYVRLDRRPIGDPGYNAWIDGLAAGRLYSGDGRSHFLEWTIEGLRSGESDVSLASPSSVTIKALVAARLEEKPWDSEATPPATPHPPHEFGWHLEKSRIAGTREVAVELIVNGQGVEKRRLLADGESRRMTFSTKIEQSSWIALRILLSSHTHPVFVNVGGKPIRASKRSAQWCRDCVDKLWEVKSPMIQESERAAAAEAYDHARRTYDQIIAESEVA
jgi:N-methylcarbamate hydrolase